MSVSLYLLNSCVAGGNQRFAGEGIDLVCESRAALDDAGAVLWASTDATVADAAAIAQRLREKGAPLAVLDSVMMAAAAASLLGDLGGSQTDITTLQGQMTTAQSNITTLQGNVTTIDSNILLAGLSYSIQFGWLNVANNLSAQQMAFGGMAADGLASFVVPADGQIDWFSTTLSANAAGGTIQVDIYKNGSSIANLTMANLTKGNHAVFATSPAAHAVAAGDRIDTRITTPAGWSATTVDCGAALGFKANVS